MASRGRPLNSRQTASARAAIGVHRIIQELTKHFEGKIDKTPTQIRAAEILLKKALPDLQAMELSGEVTTNDARDLSRAALVALARGEGIAEPDGLSDESAELHSIQ